MASSRFNDPVGLILRMLRSGNSAAKSAVMREVLQYLAVPLDLWRRRFDDRVLREASEECSQPLLLIIGGPRSGTTFVYQVLADVLNVSYLTNRTALFPGAPLSVLRNGPKPVSGTGDFTNYYGQTDGLDGPHDGFFLWNRWLGDDRYHADTALTSEQTAAMRRFFSAWCSISGRPFLNKNNRNAGCADLLADALPSAVFLVVRRDPVRVARSLIHAREDVQGSKQTGWGLFSEDCNDVADSLGYVDEVWRQVQQVNRQLDEQLAAIDPKRIIDFSYESFCRNPASVISSIIDRVPAVAPKDGLPDCIPPSFDESAGRPLSAAEEARLASCSRQLSVAVPEPVQQS